MLQQQTYHHHEPMTGMAEPSKSSRRSGMLDEIGLLLGRQFAAYNTACQSALAEKLGTTVADLKALELVMAFDALPTGHLARLMGISSGGATALINRLEAAGYVERGRHPLDRRIIVIRPVEAQCRVLAQALRPRRKARHAGLAGDGQRASARVGGGGLLPRCRCHWIRPHRPDPVFL
jgi:DNA-binding MarR family transcriptional regulator